MTKRVFPFQRVPAGFREFGHVMARRPGRRAGMGAQNDDPYPLFPEAGKRDGDFPDQLREQGPAFLVGRGLVVLDLLPFTVASHNPC